jgi:maltose O-acetyltransferase
MKFLKFRLSKIAGWIVRLTKPFVLRVAGAYGIRIERPGYAYGQHPLVFDGGEEQILHQTPASVYFNTRSGSIHVGKNTVFGEDVKVLTGKHLSIEEANSNGVELHYVPVEGRDIEIGSGCYIGSGAIIIGPVTIGNFSVIGAGSVVTKNIPAYTFAAGIPARVIRELIAK